MKTTLNTNAEAHPLLLTKKQAARELSLCTRSLENAVAAKALAVIRFGRRCVRFRPEDIRQYIERRRVKAVGE